MSVKLEVPYTLTSEFWSDKLKLDDESLDLLKRTIDRGIPITTYVASILSQGDVRYVGKTAVAFIRIADEHKNTGFSTQLLDLESYDRDLDGTSILRDVFLRGFKMFLEEYYNDLYMIEMGQDYDFTVAVKPQALNNTTK